MSFSRAHSTGICIMFIFNWITLAPQSSVNYQGHQLQEKLDKCGVTTQSLSQRTCNLLQETTHSQVPGSIRSDGIAREVVVLSQSSSVRTQQLRFLAFIQQSRSHIPQLQQCLWTYCTAFCTLCIKQRWKAKLIFGRTQVLQQNIIMGELDSVLGISQC